MNRNQRRHRARQRRQILSAREISAALWENLPPAWKVRARRPRRELTDSNIVYVWGLR
jgi:hypothetical protein